MGCLTDADFHEWSLNSFIWKVMPGPD